jgi:hypothetical protein
MAEAHSAAGETISHCRIIEKLGLSVNMYPVYVRGKVYLAAK